jgi:hypothetical protein
VGENRITGSGSAWSPLGRSAMGISARCSPLFPFYFNNCGQWYIKAEFYSHRNLSTLDIAAFVGDPYSEGAHSILDASQRRINQGGLFRHAKITRDKEDHG